METEPKELSAEELEQKETEEFEAGRNAAKGVDVDAEEKKSSDDKEPAEDADGEEVPPAFFAGLTEDELKQALAKANKFDALSEQLAQETRKIYGKFGEIQGEMKKLTSGKKISKESLKRLSENYPDIAEDLAADLEDLGPGDNSQMFEERLAKARGEMSQELQKALAERDVRMLEVAKPNWKETIAKPEWDIWLGTLPADERKAVESSPDPVVAIKALTDHEKWLGRSKDTKKQDRLSRAITPQGQAPEPPEKTTSDAAAFEAGRKAARKRLGLMR